MPPSRSMAIERRSGDTAAAIEVPSVTVISTSRGGPAVSCVSQAPVAIAAHRIARVGESMSDVAATAPRGQRFGRVLREPLGFAACFFDGAADDVDDGLDDGSARSALRRAARSMILASIAPASPPLAVRFDRQTAVVFSARMSSKSPSFLLLLGWK